MAKFTKPFLGVPDGEIYPVAACRSTAVGAVSQSARRVVGFLDRLSVNRTPQNALLLYFILIRA